MSLSHDNLLYSTLPQGNFIRCLILEPGYDNVSLECRLETFSLTVGSQPIYEAISYVWGTNEKLEEILCNGTRTKITANLSKALHRARYRLEPRTLWADSLCINQSDDAEKSHQVALMGQIYAQASRVLIHISGDDQGNASKLASIIQERNVLIRNEFSKLAFDGAFPRLEPEDKEKIMRDARWESLYYLLSQPWFSRGWVVQEAALAYQGHAIILWGKEEIVWDSLLRCLVWLMCRCPELLVSHWNKAFIHCELYAIRYPHESKAYGFDISVQGLDLSAILGIARSLRLADPRDRVLAFLSLEKYGQPNSPLRRTGLLIEPDYSKSTQEIYIEFARRQILYGDIRILHFASQDNHPSPPLRQAMPSWTPRWDVFPDAHVTSDVWRAEPLRPRQGFRGSLVRDIRDSSVLVVTGVIFDQVRYHSEAFNHKVEASDFASLWNTVKDMKLAEAYQLEQQLAVMMHCLCRGQAPPEISRSAWAAEQEALAYFLRNTDQDMLSVASNEPSGFRIFQTFIAFWSVGRKLLSTARGLLGNGPGSVADGDMCCIIFGCAAPLILRPVPGRGRGERAHYRIIGDAWIGGIDAGNGGLAGCGSEESKDWVTWGLVEEEIYIV